MEADSRFRSPREGGTIEERPPRELLTEAERAEQMREEGSRQFVRKTFEAAP